MFDKYKDGNKLTIKEMFIMAFESVLENIDDDNEFYFKKGITWNRVGSGVNFAARIACSGFVFDDVSPSGFSKDNLFYFLAYMNSRVFNDYLRLFSTGFKTEIGHIQKIPYFKISREDVSVLSKKCIHFFL